MMVTQYSNDIANTRRDEWNVLSEVTCQHLPALQNTHVFDFIVHLLQTCKTPPKMRIFLEDGHGLTSVMDVDYGTAAEMRMNCLHGCHTRDVVLARFDADTIRAAEVWFHATAKGECCTLLSFWEPVENDPAMGVRIWRENTDSVMLASSCDILAPCIYRRDDNNTAHTLVPCLYR